MPPFPKVPFEPELLDAELLTDVRKIVSEVIPTKIFHPNERDLSVLKGVVVLRSRDTTPYLTQLI